MSIRKLPAYEKVKMNVCQCTGTASDLATTITDYPPPDRPQASAHEAVSNFRHWLQLFQVMQKHDIRVPNALLRPIQPSDTWPLALVMCQVEVYLKVGELAEKVIRHRQATAGDHNDKNFMDRGDLANIRRARTTVAAFLKKFPNNIIEEANTHAYNNDLAIVALAARAQNLPMQFRLLEAEVDQRLTGQKPNLNELMAEAPSRSSHFHKTILDLGLVPIGLHPAME